MLIPAEADRLIGQHLQCLPIESLPLAQCAGAVLRENIYAERDQPPFDRVAMDGIALHGASVSAASRTLRIQGTQAAGDPPLTLAGADACIEVMTGAVLPGGCDSVVAVEEISVNAGSFAATRASYPKRSSPARSATTEGNQSCASPASSEKLTTG